MEQQPETEGAVEGVEINQVVWLALVCALRNVCEAGVGVGEQAAERVIVAILDFLLKQQAPEGSK